ncbi:MAG: hypothetical protein WDO14_22085 [Bacteroidota bacterium]
MKIKLLAVLGLFGLATMSFGNTAGASPSLTVNRIESSSIYTVSYSDVKPGKIILTIKDDQGNLLVRRVIKSENGFSMPANFSSVTEGVYHVETDNGVEKQNVRVDYNNNTAPTYSRVVDLGDGRYLLSSSHVGVETINVKIFDGSGTMIFDEDKKINGGFAMMFNLKDVVGKPSFEVSESAGHSLMIPGSAVVAFVPKAK